MIKLISWNVNGLRACINKGFEASIAQLSPDILCLQETKLSADTPHPELAGYRSYYLDAQKKGYSGTALFTRVEPQSVAYGIGCPEHDQEGRVITARFDDFTLVNVYTPNAQRDLARIDYRIQWEDAFRSYVSSLDREAPVVICGDMNVAHQEIDLKNPGPNKNNAGFFPRSAPLSAACWTRVLSIPSDTFIRIRPAHTAGGAICSPPGRITPDGASTIFWPPKSWKADCRAQRSTAPLWGRITARWN